MYIKTMAVQERTKNLWREVDLKDQRWKQKLTSAAQYVAGFIQYKAETKSVLIDMVGVIVSAPAEIISIGVHGRTAETIIITGRGFSGSIDEALIQKQDVVRLEIYNGFSGACDFDVVCWKATIFPEGNTEKAHTLSYGIR